MARETVPDTRSPVSKNNTIVKKMGAFYVAIAIIYNSGSALITVNHFVGFILLLPALAVVLIKYAGSHGGAGGTNTLNTIFVLLVTMAAISFIGNMDFDYVASNIRFVVIVFFAFVFVKTVALESFIKYYVGTMKFIVLVSLIPFLLINVADVNIVQHLPIMENITGATYYNGWLFYYSTIRQSRNMGVFWEPSIFSSMIAFGLVYEVCFTKRPSIATSSILVIGLLTTGSTGGYLLLPLLLTLYVLRYTRGFKRVLFQVIFAVSSIWSYLNIDRVISFLVLTSPTVFDKLLSDNSESVMDRLESPIENINLFLNNPFLGLGMGNVDSVYDQFDIAQTSTSTYFLAAFGFCGIVYTLAIMYASLSQRRLNLDLRVLIMVIFLWIVNKEPHSRILVTYIVLFYMVKCNTARLWPNQAASDRFSSN